MKRMWNGQGNERSGNFRRMHLLLSLGTYNNNNNNKINNNK